MQRPSHSITTMSVQTASRRIAGAGFTVLAQMAFATVLVGGVVVSVNAPPPPPFEVERVRQVEPQTPPPPPVTFERPAMPTAVAPVIDIAPEPGSGPTITVTQAQAPVVSPPAQTRVAQPPPAVPDRPATGIAATHTVPPYPTLARRLGAQGKVMLRLTVTPGGTVANAEVVRSSGRQDLDQAAQQWITAHWTYQPAIRGGAPAASQVMAAVEFSLTDVK